MTMKASDLDASALEEMMTPPSDATVNGEEEFDEKDEFESSDGEVPEWASVPASFKLPEGKAVLFIRIRAGWTDTPQKGERSCVMWNLTEADELLALKRAQGDGWRTVAEMTKQSIRVVDGQVVDWTKGTPLALKAFWNDIGGKVRMQLRTIHSNRHTMNIEEAADFLGRCVKVRGPVL